MKRTPMKVTRKLINRVGPVTAKWIEVRNEWMQKNATPSRTWVCSYCPKILAAEAIPEFGIEVLTLDHVKPKSVHRELRFVQNNLVAACWGCNHEKGPKNWRSS